MPSFQISDPGSAIALTDAIDNGKALARGSVVLAVENTTPQNRSATIRVMPGVESEAGFYSLAGGSAANPGLASIEFAPRQVQNITVTIAAAKAAIKKSCSFRLRVMLESDPENDAAEGRPVVFDLPAQPAAAAVAGQPFPWGAVAAAVVLMVGLAGGLTYVLWPAKGPAPQDQPTINLEQKIIGKSKEFAEGIVTGAGMTPIFRIVQGGDKPPNSILSAARDTADATKMILTYDPGIGGLKGKTVEAAKAAATGWGLAIVDRVTPEGDAEPGVVVSAGLDPQDPTRLMLSYDQGVEVPNLVGQYPTRIGDTFSTLPGRATGSVERIDTNPNECGSSITAQRPLKNAQANSKSFYKTGQSFFFVVSEGTKVGVTCGIILLPWRDRVKILPNVLFQPIPVQP